MSKLRARLHRELRWHLGGLRLGTRMSPRSGGEADKIGNRYEGRWTVHWLLQVLAGRARSIVVERRGPGGEGVEFTVIGIAGDEASHQVKRQRGNRNGWSLRELEAEGVLAAAAAHIA